MDLVLPAPRQDVRARFPDTLINFVWQMTSWRQVVICEFAIIVALLNFAPIEVQRRLIDDAISKSDVKALIWLGALYGLVVVSSVAFKYVLLVAQSWIGESAVKHARDDLLAIGEKREPHSTTGGQAVTVIGTEVDKLGGFVGEHLSQAVVNGTLILAISIYMLVVEPLIALYSFAIILPQAILTPVLQEKLNKLVERHLGLVRQLGDQLVEDQPAVAPQRTVAAIFRNRLRFFMLKYGLKSALNLVNAFGPMLVLLIGGYMVIQGQTTIGIVVAFVSGFDRLSQPLRDLLAFYREVAQAGVQLRMIHTWIDKVQQTRAWPA